MSPRRGQNRQGCNPNGIAHLKASRAGTRPYTCLTGVRLALQGIEEGARVAEAQALQQRRVAREAVGPVGAQRLLPATLWCHCGMIIIRQCAGRQPQQHIVSWSHILQNHSCAGRIQHLTLLLSTLAQQMSRATAAQRLGPPRLGIQCRGRRHEWRPWRAGAAP